MKFTFDRDAMIKEIAIAQEVITNKSPISILSNILIIAENGILTIKATDSNDDYGRGMRNGMRYVKYLIDGKEPQFEQNREQQGENK